jgi:hypothetical protein
MPIFEFAHCATRIEKLRKSFEDAKSLPETCPVCGQAMRLVEAYRVSFTEFRPFRTSSFSTDGREIDVTDRGQLRRLLRENRMYEAGDKSNYFGSSEKSIPTMGEIARFGKGGISEKTQKMLKAGLVGAVDARQWTEMREQDKRTRSGRKAKLPMTESDRKKLYELKNSGAIQLAGA